ncbi:MAG: AMP-binding protein [Gammaproteobacteria bacterium]|nr:AMP-binding protein [Gammaproteobacteria bacterium]
MDFEQGSEIVWRPGMVERDYSQIARFMRHCQVPDYDTLLRRADSEAEWFWQHVIDFLGIRFAVPYHQLIDSARAPQWSDYCVGGETNIVANCLDCHRDTATYDQIYIQHERESGEQRALTYRQVDAEVGRLAAALHALGLGAGDGIGIYMPMIPEVAIAFLAIVKIGAIAIPLFSGFGPEPIAIRLNDGGARAVLTVDAAVRRGVPIALKSVIDAARERIPSLEHVIVFRNLDTAPAWQDGDHWWHELLAAPALDSHTAIVAAQAPMMLVYTSGTTGLPKGTVQSHCGLLMKILFDMCVSGEFTASDRMLWMSDMGWVVGPIQIIVSAFRGATLVMGEGAFNFPQPGRIWRLIEQQGVTWLGLAPTIARHYLLTAPEAARAYDLSSLRTILSTGEPWTPDAWQWLFTEVGKRRLPILNYSGGTEIGGGILGCTVVRPLKPCCFNTALPGMSADIVDGEGRSVPVGEVGELALRHHSPGLTRGLWRDPQRYLDSYWNTVPDVWIHGDWAARDADGMWYLLGRSDDTLKISGKRTGPAEIEGPLLATAKISEVAVIGIPDDSQGSAVVCVCVALPNMDLSALRDELTAVVVQAMGKAYRPRNVLFVADLPKTRTLKIMRRVVKAVLLGTEPGDLSSLANPESLDALRAVHL